MSASRVVEIVNERGLHARASAKFVKLAATFDAEVTVTRDGTTVDARSIMGLMMLAAGLGSHVEIAGLNLPMLIKLASVRGRENLQTCVAYAQEAGRKYISVASYVLAGEK